MAEMPRGGIADGMQDRGPSTAHSDSQSESKCSAQDDKKLRDTPTVCSELQVPRLGATCVAQASLGMTATNQ